MTLPILYSFRRCPYAMRARMALLTGGIQVELREVVLRDRPDHMMEISPERYRTGLASSRWNSD